MVMLMPSRSHYPTYEGKGVDYGQYEGNYDDHGKRAHDHMIRMLMAATVGIAAVLVMVTIPQAMTTVSC